MPEETHATTEALVAPETATPAPETDASTSSLEQQIEITPETLSDVAVDARDAVLFGGTPAPSKDSAQEPDAETNPPAETEKSSDEPPPSISDADFTKNFRLHTDNKQFSSYLRALKAAAEVNPNVNPADVARAVGYDSAIYGINADAQPEAESVEQSEPPAIAAIRAELENVEVQLDEAGAEEGLINPQIINLIKEQGRLNAKLGALELRDSLAREASDNAERTSRLTARESVKSQVLKEYPSANSDDSSLGVEIGRLHRFIQSNPQHPDHARISADDYPRWITEQSARNVAARTAKEFGLTEAQALQAMRGKPITEAKGPAVTASPASSNTTTQSRPVPRNVQVTASGGKIAPSGTTLTFAQLRDVAADPKARDAALGFGGNMIVR